MNLWHRNIEYFLKCAEVASFQQAARESGITQAAMSTAIRNFENELSQQLFERKSKGVKLTPEGQRLYDLLAKRSRSLERELMHTLEPGAEMLTFGCTGHFAARKLIPYLESHTDIFPKYRMYVGFSFINMTNVLKGAFDFGLVTWTDTPKDVIHHRIEEDPYHYVGLKSVFPEVAKAKSLKDLKKYPMVVLPKIQRDIVNYLPERSKGYVVNSYENYRYLLLSGLAVGAAQTNFFTEEEQRGFAVAPFPVLNQTSHIYLVLSKNASPRIKAMGESLAAALKKMKPECVLPLYRGKR